MAVHVQAKTVRRQVQTIDRNGRELQACHRGKGRFKFGRVAWRNCLGRATKVRSEQQGEQHSGGEYKLGNIIPSTSATSLGCAWQCARDNSALELEV